MKQTWTLELDHDETIALARAIWLQFETSRLLLRKDDLTTRANLLQIIEKFPTDGEFAAITPQIVEEKQP